MSDSSSFRERTRARSRGQRARRLILLQPHRPRHLARGMLDAPGPRTNRIVDPESGLVSHETTTRERHASEYRWDRCHQFGEFLGERWGEQEEEEILNNDQFGPLYRPRVPRLFQLAMDTVVENVDSITYETVQHMAPLVLGLIWRELNKRYLNSFNTWKIFSKFLDRKQGALLNQFRYINAIREPVPSLSVYTKPLTSTTFDFLAHLSITTAFSTSDLVALSALTNLVALEIINPAHGNNLGNAGKVFDSSFGDRVIKTWSESAIKGKGFQILRILKLRNFEGITDRCFRYINDFPVLAVFDVLACGFEGLDPSEAEMLGWVAHPDGAFLEILQSDCVKHTMALRTTLGLPVRPVRRPTAKPLRHKARIKMVPRADVPAILAADRASTPSTAPNPAHHLTPKRVRRLRKTSTGRAKLAQMGFPHREAVDPMTTDKELRALEMWEFRTYTALHRIGELRRDEDLRAAGLDVGDCAPLVSGEFLSAIPVASLRLGPHLADPVARGPLRRHQPFYDDDDGEMSVYDDGETSHSERGYTVGRNGGWGGAMGFVYTRVDWPFMARMIGSAGASVSVSARARDEGASASGGGEEEIGDSAADSGLASRRNNLKRRKVRGGKRQQLGHLLAGVMPGGFL
ncbi:hypothetical protein DSL72_005021 [Monilinia vaccinii-corymbosi]|uniref:Cbs domain-containing protein n=1 Tax=Monilinia vaccinii-corymbosi TaxID=61207 RepID=A0A8A3PEG3_9HELO|nr:hypothetical protein DSL72_005021 [Monilinia vaccinii-corymbosi]